MPLNFTYFGCYCHIPILLVDVDSYENLLSFERNFVSLHTGTVFNCLCTLFSLQLQIYNPIIIVPTFCLENYEKHRSGLPCGWRCETSKERYLILSGR